MLELNFWQATIGDQGKSIIKEELASMTAIYNLSIDFYPVPITCGTYKSNPSTHFFLSLFQNFTGELPDIPLFYKKVTQICLKSVSPTGKFSFPVTTHHGNFPRYNVWNTSWEDFFAQSLDRILKLEIDTQGPNKDIKELRNPLFKKVIPRLLRPLKTEGRSIKPSLIYGDL